MGEKIECPECDGYKRIVVGHYPRFNVRTMEVEAGELIQPCDNCAASGYVYQEAEHD